MICFLDLDGTCCDATERFSKAGPEPKERGKEYSAWLQRVQNNLTLIQDFPIPGMKELSWLLNSKEVSHVVYLTGRSEIYRTVTEKWLYDHAFAPVEVIMRPKKNRQNNRELKERLIKQYIDDTDAEHEAILVIDDDYNGDIEEMCHRNGYTFLKAKSGNPFFRKEDKNVGKR